MILCSWTCIDSSDVESFSTGFPKLHVTQACASYLCKRMLCHIGVAENHSDQCELLHATLTVHFFSFFPFFVLQFSVLHDQSFYNL